MNIFQQRRLEEEATLSELEWKIELDHLNESKLSPVVSSVSNTSTFKVNKQSHSTTVTSEYVTRDGINSQPSAVYVLSDGAPQSTEPHYPSISRPSDTVMTRNDISVKGFYTPPLPLRRLRLAPSKRTLTTLVF